MRNSINYPLLSLHLHVNGGAKESCNRRYSPPVLRRKENRLRCRSTFPIIISGNLMDGRVLTTHHYTRTTLNTLRTFYSHSSSWSCDVPAINLNFIFSYTQKGGAEGAESMRALLLGGNVVCLVVIYQKNCKNISLELLFLSYWEGQTWKERVIIMIQRN